MWMKCTLRAEALRRGGKGVGTHCVSSTHKCSARVKGIKEIHCGCAVWLLTEIKLCPLTFHITSGLCVNSASVSELLLSKQNTFCLHSNASFLFLSHVSFWMGDEETDVTLVLTLFIFHYNFYIYHLTFKHGFNMGDGDVLLVFVSAKIQQRHKHRSNFTNKKICHINDLDFKWDWLAKLK